VGFSGTADLMALFSIRINSRWWPPPSWIISNGHISATADDRAVIFAIAQLSCSVLVFHAGTGTEWRSLIESFIKIFPKKIHEWGQDNVKEHGVCPMLSVFKIVTDYFGLKFLCHDNQGRSS